LQDIELAIVSQRVLERIYSLSSLGRLNRCLIPPDSGPPICALMSTL